MIDRWFRAINEDSMVGVVMVDFHHICLEENKKSQLVTFYQKMTISINGVPQGSILGQALLFLLFINDLPLYTDKVATDLRAHDTTLINSRNQE